ncbi:hypothetical protein SAMN05428957_10837 [Oryzisolibacter propanilivorax]|uniref:Uncharacterized protein n=1 Tax=Oryzisolibacter propanilivorax TaxID=1527607 RepID=A0A1G9U9R5_9BURK|nr:hypothetical protein [Oryzisolibacter propanilivorax]SDM56285.1 hypothetical protein SAMN05428957_10837 [Oryzisolibacter propanilivorax]
MTTRHPFARSAAVALLLSLLGAQAAQAACYILYDARRQVVYQAQTPPVDLSFQLHETVPRVVPGGTLVFTLDSDACVLQFNRLPVGVTAQGAFPPVVPAVTARRAPVADRG